MKRQLLGCFLAGVCTIGTPTVTLAQDEDSKVYDARLEEYEGNVTLENSSTALVWLLLVVLGALCVGVMFKNAKRTHLD